MVNALMDGPEVDAEVSWDIRWSHPMGRTKIRDAQNGFVGWAAVGGMGTHTVTGQAPEHLPFESDVRFMSGEFIGADGHNHHGAFAFI